MLEKWRIFPTDQLESSTAKRTQRYARISEYWNKFETKMSVSRRKKKRASVATRRRTKPIVASVLQHCSNCKIGILQATDPTLHCKLLETR